MPTICFTWDEEPSQSQLNFWGRQPWQAYVAPFLGQQLEHVRCVPPRRYSLTPREPMHIPNIPSFWLRGAWTSPSARRRQYGTLSAHFSWEPEKGKVCVCKCHVGAHFHAGRRTWKACPCHCPLTFWALWLWDVFKCTTSNTQNKPLEEWGNFWWGLVRCSLKWGIELVHKRNPGAKVPAMLSLNYHPQTLIRQ